MTSPTLLFLDRSLGDHVVADTLRGAGEAVEVHADHFAPDAPDDLWLPEVARRGWIVLTADRGVRRRAVLRWRVTECGARLFAITSGGMTGPDLAAALARLAPRIRQLADDHPRPFIGTVRASGKVAIWRDRKGLLGEPDGPR